MVHVGSVVMKADWEEMKVDCTVMEVDWEVMPVDCEVGCQVA